MKVKIGDYESSFDEEAEESEVEVLVKTKKRATVEDVRELTGNAMAGSSNSTFFGDVDEDPDLARRRMREEFQGAVAAHGAGKIIGSSGALSGPDLRSLASGRVGDDAEPEVSESGQNDNEKAQRSETHLQVRRGSGSWPPRYILKVVSGARTWSLCQALFTQYVPSTGGRSRSVFAPACVSRISARERMVAKMTLSQRMMASESM
jgi:hypothetical protein